MWNERARSNWYVAIYDNEATRDPQRRAAAFDEGGREDARRLAWFVDPSMRVVDLGCGVGRVIKPLAPFCSEIIGVDISETMLTEGRRYLDGIANARLLPTEGASLAGIADRSIDFLYSLLCLIHVDRRSAYQYLREIKRVLRSGRLALLQFHNILTEEGHAKFEAIVATDYPLEFYTEQELRWFLRKAGLETVSVFDQAEYLFFVVCQGSAPEWIQSIVAGIETDGLTREGSFHGSTHDRSGVIRVTVRSRLDQARTFMPSINVVTTEGGERSTLIARADAVLVLKPGATCELTFSRDGANGDLTVRVDGRPAPLNSSRVHAPNFAGPAMVHAGILPSGFHWSPETLVAFPHLFCSHPVEWKP
jgi:SAM-dependent methyltransferase